MFSTIMTIMRGRSERAREGLEAAHATVIIEQKIREADQGHDRAKRSLASLILRERNEARALAALKTRIADLEERTRSALAAGKEALARDGAQAIADMENEKTAREGALERTRLAVQRHRLMIEKSERRLIDLRQGLITARSLDAERATARDLRGNAGGMAAIAEAEAVLGRALNAADPIEELDILDGINAELSGDDVFDRMAAEGFGKAARTSGDDVLARLVAETTAQSGQPSA